MTETVVYAARSILTMHPARPRASHEAVRDGRILGVSSLADLQRSGVDHPGIPLGSDGLPSGELKGPEAMTPAFGPVGLSRSFLSGDEAGIRSSTAPRWPASRRGRRRRVAWPARWPTCRPRERPSPPFTVAVGHCCTARPCIDPARRPACTRSVIASNVGAPMTQTAPAPTSRPPQRSLRQARRWALLLATAAALASPAHAAFTLFKGTAANPAGLTATRDSFRNLVGGGNTAGANGDFGGVRREINWDGVGNALADPNALPADFFNNTSPRGVVLSTPTPGASFAVSANAGQAVAPLFGFPGDLQTFSAQRLFASVGGRITDIHFFVPGTTTPATTSAFAAIFVDVEDNTATSFTQVEFFDSNNALILSRHAVPAGNQGLSFVGAVAGAGERIARVRITTPDNFVISNGVRANENFDFVVMDDFLYATPLAVPVPETAPWAMALLGLGALGLKARRWR